MTLREFYRHELDEAILQRLDHDYNTNRATYIAKLEAGTWTKSQKKMQKKAILRNIVLYHTFLGYGISPEKAKTLVAQKANDEARKIHKVLKILFYLPLFSKIFCYFMAKGISKNKEIWQSEILISDNKKLKFDVTKCLWADTCKYFDCYEICEVFCLCDHIVFGEIDKLGFKRNTTLGMQGDRCDFCFEFLSPKKRS